MNVIAYAFKKKGNAAAAKKSWSLGKHGTELAAYLVNMHKWNGVYINPDVNHPQDADSEHSFTSYLASRKCQYYKIPLEYKVENYTVTPKTHDAFQKLNKTRDITKLNTIGIAGLELVSFGFGVSRGGRHTWLFSKGNVYEVHWDKAGEELYEASPLRTYLWLSGAIVVPPDQAHLLAISSKLSCG